MELRSLARASYSSELVRGVSAFGMNLAELVAQPEPKALRRVCMFAHDEP